MERFGENHQDEVRILFCVRKNLGEKEPDWTNGYHYPIRRIDRVPKKNIHVSTYQYIFHVSNTDIPIWSLVKSISPSPPFDNSN